MNMAGNVVFDSLSELRLLTQSSLRYPRQHLPGLPILFISGYAQNAAAPSDFLGANMQMISKPCQIEVPAGKIDEMLK